MHNTLLLILTKVASSLWLQVCVVAAAIVMAKWRLGFNLGGLRAERKRQDLSNP